ncbi:MBL fold metallo-hydrolase [Deinococcus cavernae]|uniref:MBL fold metallo-hydrolase n=1 Tax=Deinococcus cavernae TaxID=2320857 RepID=A0A418VHG3_9DEIO|nr:excalibur calcium-binding domain-containing protein [Deinococcus cavernae]RJF75571.1 MBL fold metallo-hydrolase [Deinococcus cavernae]
MRRLLTLAALSLGFAAAQAAPAGVLTIRFLDVGQGDAVLITSPEGKSVLVDGGKSESQMRELIRQYDIKNVSLVVATHADSDHITGLVPIVALNRPQYFLNNGLAGTTRIWEKLTNVVQQAGTKGLKASDQVINLGSVKLTVLPPPPGMKDQNTNSVGLLVQYGTFRALMTGDSESPETMAWLRRYSSGTFGPVDVYKSIHHGAANGDTITWLRAVQPKNVVISVGPNNYGHPTPQALDLYRSVNATTYRTDQQGTVTVTVQPGGRYAITTERGAAVPTRTPVPAVPVTPTPGGTIKSPAPLTPPPARETYYPNCAAVRAAGAAPLLRGQPGYRAGLDRDGDGRACEN